MLGAVVFGRAALRVCRRTTVRADAWPAPRFLCTKQPTTSPPPQPPSPGETECLCCSPTPSKRRGRKLPPPVEVSDDASNIIKALLKARPEVIGMRLACKETDFTIVPTFGYEIEGQQEPTDERYEVNGVAIYVDGNNFLKLLGTKIGFVEQEGFTFDMPNSDKSLRPA